SGRKRLSRTLAGHSFDVTEAKDMWQDRLLILAPSASTGPTHKSKRWAKEAMNKIRARGARNVLNSPCGRESLPGCAPVRVRWSGGPDPSPGSAAHTLSVAQRRLSDRRRSIFSA